MRFKFFLFLLLLCALPIQANGQTADNKNYHAVNNAVPGFAQLGKDMHQTLGAMKNKAGAQYDCFESMLTSTIEMRESLQQYKFSVAIIDSLIDERDLKRAKPFLKIQTDTLLKSIEIKRKLTNELIGACAKFPIVVTKGQALLNALSGADSILRSIATQL